jgi:hypothetical protein
MLSRPRTLPAGFIQPCLPMKAPKPPTGALWLHPKVGFWHGAADPEMSGLQSLSGIKRTRCAPRRADRDIEHPSV